MGVRQRASPSSLTCCVPSRALLWFPPPWFSLLCSSWFCRPNVTISSVPYCLVVYSSWFALAIRLFVSLNCVSPAWPVIYINSFPYLLSSLLDYSQRVFSFRVTYYRPYRIVNRKFLQSPASSTCATCPTYLIQFRGTLITISVPLLWIPLLHIPCCALAARDDLRSRLYIKRVPPAANDKDSVVVRLLLVLVRYRRPFLLYNLCHRPQLCPHLYNVRSARIAPDPGTLPGIKHVIAVVNGNRIIAGSLP